MLGYKKGETKELCCQMALHYPADRVYLDGDTTKTVQDAILKSAEIELTSQSISAGGATTIAFPAEWNSRQCVAVSLKATNNATVWLVGQPVYRPTASSGSPKWVVTILNSYTSAITLEGSLIVYYR